jgi:hypothetical protein
MEQNPHISNDLQQYYAFYTHSLFWAGNMPDFTHPQTFENFAQTLSQVIASYDEQFYTLKICRDGCILFHSKFQNLDFSHILEYINTFVLLLSSQAHKWAFQKYIDPFELQRAHVIPHTYKGEALKGHNTSKVDATTLHTYNARFLQYYIPLDYTKIAFQDAFWLNLIKHTVISDYRIKARKGRVLPVEFFHGLNSIFAHAITNFETVTLLARLNRPLQDHAHARYDISLMQSWILLESYLYIVYKKQPAVPALTDDTTITDILKVLQRKKVFSYDFISHIHDIRRLRNRIIHDSLSTHTTKEDSEKALLILKACILRDTGIDLTI